MKKVRQQVRYEFYTFQSSTVNFYTTLVLENPAEVKFFNVSTFAGGIATINNQFTLNSINAVAPTNPNTLFLTNNVNEYDTTNYQLLLQPGTIINVIAKYYIS